MFSVTCQFEVQFYKLFYVVEHDADNLLSINQSVNLFAKYDIIASIINSGGRTTRQLTALTVALEKHK